MSTKGKGHVAASCSQPCMKQTLLHHHPVILSGGFPVSCHNEIRDLTADFKSEVLSVASMHGPDLQTSLERNSSLMPELVASVSHTTQQQECTVVVQVVHSGHVVCERPSFLLSGERAALQHHHGRTLALVLIFTALLPYNVLLSASKCQTHYQIGWVSQDATSSSWSKQFGLFSSSNQTLSTCC